MITSLVNAPAWKELPQLYKDAYETAANEQNLLMLAKYDQKNPAALKRLIAGGTKLRAFPQPVIETARSATRVTPPSMRRRVERLG